jgi:voltage-gated potassium channel
MRSKRETSEPTPAERRAAERLSRSSSVYFTSGRTEGRGTLVDLSSTGARVEDASTRLRPGAPVTLTLELRNEGFTFELRGRVARETQTGFAVELHLDPDPSVEALMRWILARPGRLRTVSSKRRASHSPGDAESGSPVDPSGEPHGAPLAHSREAELPPEILEPTAPPEPPAVGPEAGAAAASPVDTLGTSRELPFGAPPEWDDAAGWKPGLRGEPRVSASPHEAPSQSAARRSSSEPQRPAGAEQSPTLPAEPSAGLSHAIYSLLEARATSGTARTIQGAVHALILLNVVAVALGTVEPFATRHAAALDWFAGVSLAAFTIEYVARLFACTADPEYDWPGGRLRFALSPLPLVDALVIAPGLLGLGVDLRSLRAVRLLGALRGLDRASRAAGMLARALKDAAVALGVLAYALVIAVIVLSTALYVAEHPAQPEAFSSIPQTAWWTIATLTMVGHAWLSPITPIGKIIGALIAVLGIGFLALAAGLFAAAFVARLAPTRSRCPSCGEKR